MELIRGLHNLRPRHRGCVAAIGAFDGLHRGHQAVLAHLREQAAVLGLPATVVVFEPLPREYFAPLQAPARLMSFREKCLALENLGIDRVLRIRFDAAFSRMSAEDFIQRVFVEGLGVKAVIAGDDLRFGHERAGDFDLLRTAGLQAGFTVSSTSACVIDGERVSSTRLRQALEASDFRLAETLLGRPYAMAGKVIYGRQLGRQIGVPTANLQLHRLRAPLSGVYAVDVAGLGETRLPGVANIGTRPTVDDSLTAILEVHLLDTQVDCYGRHIQVFFRHKLRDERKFASLDALRNQIENDIADARRLFGAAA